MHARIQRFIGDRLVGQLHQLVQLTIQTVQFRNVHHLAGMMQPGLDAFDTRQLLGEVLRLLLLARQLQGDGIVGEQARQPVGDLRGALAVAAHIAIGRPGSRQQPARSVQ